MSVSECVNVWVCEHVNVWVRYYVSKDYDNTVKIREGEKGFFLKKKEMNLGGVIVKNSAYLPIQMHESILKGLL